MNFLQAYKAYTESYETPANYHYWCSIFVASTMLSRKCFFPQGMLTAYPNLYIVLVGDSGQRKNPAIALARNIIRSVPDVPVCSESLSREALIDSMEANRRVVRMGDKSIEYHPTTALVTEMSEFLTVSQERLISFLTTIWDETKFEYTTRGKGTNVIPYPYFNLLGACTPTWITEQLKFQIISQGFARRALFVYEDTLNVLNPMPITTPEQLEAWPILVAEARRMYNMVGHFVMTPDALDWWCRPNTGFYARCRDEADGADEKVKAYYQSRHTLALKVGMCLSACYSSNRTISVSILEQVETALKVAESKLPQLLSGTGRNLYKQIGEKLLDTLERCPKDNEGRPHMKVADAFATVYSDCSHDEFLSLVNSLVTLGHVELVASGGARSTVHLLKARVRAKTVSLWQKVRQPELHEQILPPDYVEPESAPQESQDASQSPNDQETAPSESAPGKTSRAPRRVSLKRPPQHS